MDEKEANQPGSGFKVCKRHCWTIARQVSSLYAAFVSCTPIERAVSEGSVVVAVVRWRDAEERQEEEEDEEETAKDDVSHDG